MMKFNEAPHILIMIRPVSAAFDSPSSGVNFSQRTGNPDAREVLKRCQNEFDGMIDILELHDIAVRVFDDTPLPPKPGAIFPGSWITLHEDGKIVLYPIQAERRREERRPDILESLKKEFKINEVIDLRDEEKSDRFLEGAGSMVFDHRNRIVYACRSVCTNEAVLQSLCARLGYKAIVFDSILENGQPVHYTSMMLCVGTRFAVVCLDSIRREEDQDLVLDRLASTNHKVIAISYEQMYRFAGNIIEVQTNSREPAVLISERGFNSLLPGQVDAITRFAELIPININTIEEYGGGSVGNMAVKAMIG